MNEFFTIEIPCTPLVRKFLVRKFGNKIILASDPVLHTFFEKLLDRSLSMNNHKIDLSKYRSRVTVYYSEFTFKRIGFIMSKTDVQDFNIMIEGLMKDYLFIPAVDLMLKFNDNLSHCIRTFQESNGFTEDDWQFETLKKYYVRNSDFYRKFCAANVPENAATVPNKKIA
jgi:hypothetical protein